MKEHRERLSARSVTAGQMPDQVYSVKWNGEEKLSYTYDPLGRLSTRALHVTGNVESIPQLTTQYSYVNVGEDRTTTMVQSVTTMGVTHNYTYDTVGNIRVRFAQPACAGQ